VLETISVIGIRLRRWVGLKLRALLRPGSFIIGAVAVGYAVCQLMKDQSFPSDDAWSGHHFLGVLRLVLGVVALIGTFLVFAGYGRAIRRSDQNDELDMICRGLWQHVVQTLGVEMPKIGVHIWDVKGIKGFRFLGRRATFVIDRRKSAQVLWRKGKGAIGIAWGDDEPVLANVEALARKATSERLFCEIPKVSRFGLDWREFRRSRQYRAILAHPLRHDGRVIGCLSVDLQVDGRADDLANLVNDDPFNHVLAVCEAVLATR
jgi:hypothetical protein